MKKRAAELRNGVERARRVLSLAYIASRGRTRKEIVDAVARRPAYGVNIQRTSSVKRVPARSLEPGGTFLAFDRKQGIRCRGSERANKRARERTNERTASACSFASRLRPRATAFTIMPPLARKSISQSSTRAAQKPWTRKRYNVGLRD